MGAFHLATQINTSVILSLFVFIHWKKIEWCLCRLVSLNEKHPILGRIQLWKQLSWSFMYWKKWKTDCLRRRYLEHALRRKCTVMNMKTTDEPKMMDERGYCYEIDHELCRHFKSLIASSRLDRAMVDWTMGNIVNAQQDKC